MARRNSVSPASGSALRCRHSERWLLIAALTGTGCDASGCNGGSGLDLTNGVDPTDDVPANLVDVAVPVGEDISVWSSDWDNPPVMGLAQLTEYQSAERGGSYTGASEWLYADFDLVAAVDPSSASLGSSAVLYTWPLAAGEYTPGDQFLWEAHGLALPPRITKNEFEGIVSVQALRADELPSEGSVLYETYKPYENPGLFQLSPESLLVPLNVVTLYVDGDPNYGVGWLGKAYLQYVFDNSWVGSAQTKDYGLGLWGVFGEWQTGCDDCPPTSAMVQPDHVWDQCNIQFRGVSYFECPVPADLFWYDVPNLGLPEAAACSPGTADELIQKALLDCPGYDPLNGAATVIFTGRLMWGSACVIQGTTTYGVLGWTAPGDQRAYISHSGLSGLVLTHELGHVLGLDDTSCVPKTLMCSTDTTLDASPHCASARARAAIRQSAFWGP